MPRSFFIFLGCIYLFQLPESFAQSTSVYPEFHECFVVKNPDGSSETLLIGYQQMIRYRHSRNPQQEIPLSIVKSDVQQGNKLLVGEDMQVRFPNSNKLYRLQRLFAVDVLDCTNPDGSVQNFQLDYSVWGDRGTFRHDNSDKTIEYLYVAGGAMQGIRVLYSSSKNPNWVTLEVLSSEIAEMDRIVTLKVKFAGRKEIYRLDFLEERTLDLKPNLRCTNPDGSVQLFRWINK